MCWLNCATFDLTYSYRMSTCAFSNNDISSTFWIIILFFVDKGIDLVALALSCLKVLGDMQYIIFIDNLFYMSLIVLIFYVVQIYPIFTTVILHVISTFNFISFNLNSCLQFCLTQLFVQIEESSKVKELGKKFQHPKENLTFSSKESQGMMVFLLFCR